MGDLSGPEEISRGKPGAGGFEAQASKALEDSARERIPVADQESEDADKQGLSHEAGQDVFVCTPGPEQAGQRDIDCRECRREISDIASEQPESGIDVAGKCLQELVDNAGAAHCLILFWLRN